MLPRVVSTYRRHRLWSSRCPRVYRRAAVDCSPRHVLTARGPGQLPECRTHTLLPARTHAYTGSYHVHLSSCRFIFASVDEPSLHCVQSKTGVRCPAAAGKSELLVEGRVSIGAAR